MLQSTPTRHDHGGRAIGVASPARAPLTNLTNCELNCQQQQTSKHHQPTNYRSKPPIPPSPQTLTRVHHPPIHTSLATQLPPFHPVNPTTTSLAATPASSATASVHTCTQACKTMHAIKSFPDTSKYDGDVCIESQKKHGKGTFINRHGHTYLGSWMDDKRCGEGQYTWTSGDIYIGSWKHNTMDGHGLFKWAQGEQYLGQWKAGRMCGMGTKSFLNGDSYTGMWKNDKSNGIGCKIFACGDRHEGEYLDERRHGYGAYFWASGDSYQGNWVQGKMDGMGIKKMSCGDKYEGVWKDDKANGFGVKTFAGGDRHEGEYVSDLRHGYGVYYWTSGDRFEGVWHLGEQLGTGTYYYANNDVFKGKWLNGRKNGRGIFTSGTSSWLERWENGVRVEKTPCKFYPPRLLKTLREPTPGDMKTPDAADEARVIREQIQRLSTRLSSIKGGHQWQSHVRSSQLNNLVSRSAAALLSPQQQQQSNPSTTNSMDYTNSIPSPAAELEAAAAATSVSSSNEATNSLAIIISSPNGTSKTTTTSPIDSSPIAMETDSSSSSSDPSSLNSVALAARPVSPLTAASPLLDVPHQELEGEIPSSVQVDGTCRASTPTLTAMSPRAGATSTTATSGAGATPPPIPDEQLCKVCFQSEINTVLLPCAHVAVCLDCSTMLERCCICRAAIDDAIQTFKA